MKTKFTEKANAKLLANHFPDPSVIDSTLDSLHQAKALAGFICDIATLAQSSNFPEMMTPENLEATARAIVLNIKDAEILITDYLDQQGTIHHAEAMKENSQAPSDAPQVENDLTISPEAKNYIELLGVRYRAVKGSFEMLTVFKNPSAKSALCMVEEAEYLLDTAKNLYAAMAVQEGKS